MMTEKLRNWEVENYENLIFRDNVPVYSAITIITQKQAIWRS